MPLEGPVLLPNRGSRERFSSLFAAEGSFLLPFEARGTVFAPLRSPCQAMPAPGGSAPLREQTSPLYAPFASARAQRSSPLPPTDEPDASQA